MKIFLIETKVPNKLLGELKKHAAVSILDSNENDINNYLELFRDNDPKIIGINTGIINWELPVSVLKKIDNLKGIASKSSWVFYLDIDYCKQNNIKVTNIAGANSQSVAEYAIWMMFSLARKLPLQMNDNFKTATNEKTIQTEVTGKRMGIVGLGNIGTRIAKMGKGLGMKVSYWSPKSRNDKYSYSSLNKLLQESDCIFNWIEAYKKTENFFNKKKLSQMKKSAYFISVMGGMGWGPEDNNYLITMLNQGRLAGLAIENEHEPKYKLPKVKKGANFLMPGAYAFYTKEAQQRSNEMWIESIIGMINGKDIRRVC